MKLCASARKRGAALFTARGDMTGYALDAGKINQSSERIVTHAMQNTTAAGEQHEY